MSHFLATLRKPILRNVFAALESLRKAHPEAEYVFVRKNGAPIQDFRRAWINATEKAGLEGRRFHGLRRGMVTRLMASGIDSQAARMITGYKDAATFEQYRQLQRTAILQAGKTLESSQKTLRRS